MAPHHTAWEIEQAFAVHELLPALRAFEGHWFVDSAESWAFRREQELRDERAAREVEREVAAAEWPFEWPR